jgi:AraC-like DNA-binding protein
MTSGAVLASSTAVSGTLMNDESATLDTERWIRFANCWQSLLATTEQGASLANIRRIVDEFVHPDLLVPQFLLRTIISGGLLSCIRTCSVDERASLTPLLMEFVTREGAPDALRLECLRLLDRCQEVTEGAGSRPQASETLIRVLTIIDAAHRDAELTLHHVATAAQLSVSYISRLLNRHLGCGFRTHLNRLRIVSAQRLLEDHTLSVKQVAASVGYRSTSEFDRHFRRLCGTTPAAFRRSMFFPLRTEVVSTVPLPRNEAADLAR